MPQVVTFVARRVHADVAARGHCACTAHAERSVFWIAPLPTLRIPASRDLQQGLHQPFRRVDHHIVTRIRGLEGAPGRVGLAFRERLVEGGLRILRGANVSLLRHLLARAAELDRLQRDAVGLRRGLGIDPGAVLLVDVEGFRLGRRPRGLAFRDRLQQRLAAELACIVGAALAVFRLECVEPDDGRDAVADLLERARARPAAIGMHHQAHVLEVFPFEDVDDIGDVGVEVDVLAHEMRALADARQRRREHLVTLLLQEIGDAPPAPAAMPGPVHQHERLLRAGLRRRRRAAECGRARADRGAGKHVPASDRIVWLGHRVLPVGLILTVRCAGVRCEGVRCEGALAVARSAACPPRLPTL